MSRLERHIGAFLLLLTGGIVLTCVIVARHPGPKLMEIQPGSETRAPDHLLVVARGMMPALGTAGWSDAVDIRVIHPGAAGIADEAYEGLGAFDVEYAYAGCYRCLADPSQSVSVVIFDAREPCNAFGLFKFRRPPGARPLHVGCEGWQTDSAGAFWSGRYCTRFDRSAVQTGEPTVATIADALAGVQLCYGAAFWADPLLPSVSRRPESFRYVAKHAAGFDFLDGAFLADYDSQVTAFVTDRGSAVQATDLVNRFLQFLEDRGRVQAAPAPPESPLLAGDCADRQIAVFAAGHRVYGAVGGDMASVSGLAKEMLAAARPAVAVSAVEPAGQGETAPALPEVDLAGWGPPGDIRIFTPENLWQKIDGRADSYLSFHMVRMTFGTYRNSRDPERFIDVYWYDMGESDNAFGIYRTEMGSRREPVDIGRDGYASPGGVFFWKGRHYVRVEAADDGEDLAAAAVVIARTLARGVVGEGKPLWAEALLPAADRVEGSFAYQATDAFSLDFLRDTFSADYTVGGEAFTTFVHRAPDAEQAGRVFVAYAKFFEEYGSLIKREARDGFDLLVGSSGGVTDAVFVVGRYIGGVSGAESASLAERRAISFAQALKDEQ
ncbi:MAG: hypothetical protein JSV19_12500 [Phycisphaerales bacterium]|nr:MAG: hypothetical protein JSV19_12500 [Phycisphaerales bacterium]